MEINPALQTVYLSSQDLGSSNALTRNLGLNNLAGRQDYNLFSQLVKNPQQVNPAAQPSKTYLESLFKQINQVSNSYQQGFENIHASIQAAKSDIGTSAMIGIQLDIYKLVIQQDFFAKVANKGSQVFESLMRNQ